MKRLFFALALAFMASVQPQLAHAQDNSWNTFWTWINHGQDPRLTVVGIGVGAAATGASYVMVKKTWQSTGASRQLRDGVWSYDLRLHDCLSDGGDSCSQSATNAARSVYWHCRMRSADHRRLDRGFHPAA
jgi:hypothetical protein